MPPVYPRIKAENNIFKSALGACTVLFCQRSLYKVFARIQYNFIAIGILRNIQFRQSTFKAYVAAIVFVGAYYRVNRVKNACNFVELCLCNALIGMDYMPAAFHVEQHPAAGIGCKIGAREFFAEFIVPHSEMGKMAVNYLTQILPSAELRRLPIFRISVNLPLYCPKNANLYHRFYLFEKWLRLAPRIISKNIFLSTCQAFLGKITIFYGYSNI